MKVMLGGYYVAERIWIGSRIDKGTEYSCSIEVVTWRARHTKVMTRSAMWVLREYTTWPSSAKVAKAR